VAGDVRNLYCFLCCADLLRGTDLEVIFFLPMKECPLIWVSHHLQSYLLSLLLALLIVLPATYTLGLPTPGTDTPSLIRRSTWVRLFVELS
jgi:hypothetical protein